MASIDFSTVRLRKCFFSESFVRKVNNEGVLNLIELAESLQNAGVLPCKSDGYACGVFACRYDGKSCRTACGNTG